MNGFPSPHSMTWWCVGAALLGTLAASFTITRIHRAAWAISLAWMLVLAAPLGVGLLCLNEPGGWRMLVICAALWWAMKAVVSVEAEAAGQPRLPPGRWLLFATVWFGMKPAIFARKAPTSLPDAGPLVKRGMIGLIGGAVLVILGRLVWLANWPWLSEGTSFWLATAFLLPGLSVILHFGMCTFVAGILQWSGFDCRPLMRSPLASRSLTEFWGRRWNLAFSEMTAVGVYRPVEKWGGKRLGSVLSFLFSGWLHELAISLPVMAGFGLPSLYFALHAGLVQIERIFERGKRPIERLGWLARAWTLGWLALPLLLLFHPAFLEGVVWPMVGLEAR